MSFRIMYRLLCFRYQTDNEAETFLKRFRFIDNNIQLFDEKVNGFNTSQVKNSLFAQLDLYIFSNLTYIFHIYKTLVSNNVSIYAEKISSLSIIIMQFRV